MANNETVASSLTVSARSASAFVVVGELDVSTRHQLVAAVNRALSEGHGPVTLDVGGVTYCDSIGLATFISLRKAAVLGGNDLALIRLNPRMTTLLTLTGLMEFLAGATARTGPA